MHVNRDWGNRNNKEGRLKAGRTVDSGERRNNWRSKVLKKARGWRVKFWGGDILWYRRWRENVWTGRDIIQLWGER